MENGNEPIEDQLDRLFERIEAKRIRIDSYSGYAKETFLAFDSFNLGVTTALDMLGNFTSMLKIENERRASAVNAAGDHQ